MYSLGNTHTHWHNEATLVVYMSLMVFNMFIQFYCFAIWWHHHVWQFLTTDKKSPTACTDYMWALPLWRLFRSVISISYKARKVKWCDKNSYNGLNYLLLTSHDRGDFNLPKRVQENVISLTKIKSSGISSESGSETTSRSVWCLTTVSHERSAPHRDRSVFQREVKWRDATRQSLKFYRKVT